MERLSRYVPQKKGGVYVVEQIFRPDVRCNVEDFCMRAVTSRNAHVIYDIKDIIKCTVAENGVQSYFQGLLGERFLSVILEELVNDLAQEHDSSEGPLDFAVLREKPDHRGKNYAVTWSKHFLLKYRGPTNFYVLRKRPMEQEDAWFRAEKMGIKAREIDGLAYLHAGDNKHLFVGESKTIQSWGGVKGNYFQIVTEELFPPFRELFPRHTLYFVFLARHSLIYDQNKLKDNPSKIADELLAKDVTPIFVPFPRTERRLEDYAAEMTRIHPIAKEVTRVLPQE